MTLKWAAELAKAGVLTGDEYRELSPLGLNIGDFPDPVSGASQAEQRAEQQMEAAMGRVMERTQAGALDAAIPGSHDERKASLAISSALPTDAP